MSDTTSTEIDVFSAVFGWEQHTLIPVETRDSVRQMLARIKAPTAREVDRAIDLLTVLEADPELATPLIRLSNVDKTHLAYDYVREAGISLPENQTERDEEMLALVNIIVMTERNTVQGLHRLLMMVSGSDNPESKSFRWLLEQTIRMLDHIEEESNA